MFNFLQKAFHKIGRNSIFLLNFHRKFSKSCQNFPNQLVFVQMRDNLTKDFEFSFEKQAKILHFYNFLKEFVCKLSKIFRRPRGSAPRTPYEASHSFEPPKILPAYAIVLKNWQLNCCLEQFKTISRNLINYELMSKLLLQLFCNILNI